MIDREEIVAGEAVLACQIAPARARGYPAMPVVEIWPPVVVEPNAWASRSNAPHVRPGSARAVRRAGSMRTLFMPERSIISPPSQTALPARLWHPPCSHQQIALMRELDAMDHVGNTRVADNQRWALVDHSIPDLASAVISGVARSRQFATQARFEFLDRGLIYHGSLPEVVLVSMDAFHRRGKRPYMPAAVVPAVSAGKPKKLRAGLKSPWGCTFAETPLNAISRSNWSPEVRPHFSDALRVTRPLCKSNL
jgi:hypothetical protein